jgi:PAS domain-containing protein
MPVVKQDGQESDQFTMRVDESGKITFVDQRAVQLLDQRVDDIINKYLWQCFHSADEPLVNDAFRKMMSGEQQHQLKVRLD